MEEHRFEWMSIEEHNYQHGTKGNELFAWITAGRAHAKEARRRGRGPGGLCEAFPPSVGGDNTVSRAHAASLARTNETKRFPGWGISDSHPQPPIY